MPHLGHAAELHVARHGDYPFLLFDGVWHSAGTLLDRSRHVSAGLVELGLQPGDRVVVSMPNAPEVPVLYNAIWRSGAIVAPAMFLMSPPELRHIIQDSEPQFVVTNRELIGKVTQALAGLDAAPRVICVDGGGTGTLPLSALESAPVGPVATRAAEDAAALLYTGGTTGRSKGVLLSHSNLIHAAAAGASLELGAGRELLTLPLSHSFGLLATIGALTSETQAMWVMPRRFQPETVLRLITEYRLDFMQVVPSMIQMLLTQPLERIDLSSLRVVISGGSSLAPEVYNEFERRVPSVSISEGYGLTETSTLATATPIGAAKAGSVGTALPGVEIRIVDDNGKELPRGESGEIITRSPGVMMRYWNDPEATAAVLEDGWLATGDVGYLDEDGYLFILDRKKDLIIRGGFNVFPRDVEDALLEHPFVRMAAVVGRPDVVQGEEIVAFVSLNGGARTSAQELMDWSQQRLGAYKRPREIHLVDALPLTEVGKINRKALRQTLDEMTR